VSELNFEDLVNINTFKNEIFEKTKKEEKKKYDDLLLTE
jgi:hypothetical protein